jgi:NADP-dependent 3-hydroxy acid dehydrogenase YdfG
MTSPEMKAPIREGMDKMGISPDGIARAMVFPIEQPADVDVGEIIVRPPPRVSPSRTGDFFQEARR